jgi:ATP-dependent Clp protease ATP-binding subunit ClpA
MINSFYLNDINPKDNTNDILKHIFEKSAFFNYTHLEKWNKIPEHITCDNANNTAVFSCLNEIDFIKSLLQKSTYHADLLRDFLQIEPPVIQKLELDIQQDFGKLESVSENLRVGKKPIMSILNRNDNLNELSLNLSRRITNNTLIVGHPGVGKSFLVETFARSKQYNILALNTASLVSGTKYRGEFEEKALNIFSIIAKYRFIVFIDEIHTVIGLGGSEGGIDLNNILKPIISDVNVRLIGATTEDESTRLMKDKALKRRFTLMRIKKFSSQETLQVFKDLLKNVLLYYPEIVDDSSPFVHYMMTKKNVIINKLDGMTDRFYPNKLVDFMDCCAAAFIQNLKIEDVENCISSVR